MRSAGGRQTHAHGNPLFSPRTFLLSGSYFPAILAILTAGNRTHDEIRESSAHIVRMREHRFTSCFFRYSEASLRDISYITGKAAPLPRPRQARQNPFPPCKGLPFCSNFERTAHERKYPAVCPAEHRLGALAAFVRSDAAADRASHRLSPASDGQLANAQNPPPRLCHFLDISFDRCVSGCAHLRLCHFDTRRTPTGQPARNQRTNPCLL